MLKLYTLSIFASFWLVTLKILTPINFFQAMFIMHCFHCSVMLPIKHCPQSSSKPTPSQCWLKEAGTLSQLGSQLTAVASRSSSAQRINHISL